MPAFVVGLLKFIAVMAASYLINYALTPRSKSNSNLSEVSADDWEFPQADEGTPQCVFFGDCWSQDWQVLAYGNYSTVGIYRS